jgi:hypothetical protein
MHHYCRVNPSNSTIYNANLHFSGYSVKSLFQGFCFRKNFIVPFWAGIIIQKLKHILPRWVRLQYEEQTYLAESFRLLWVEMLYGCEIFKNHKYRKKSPLRLTMSAQSNPDFHNLRYACLLDVLAVVLRRRISSAI